MGALVVLVDDEPSVSSALVRQLRAMGVTAVVVADPLDTEAVLDVERPVAIICDKRMPRRSGIDVLRAVKASHPQIARCLLTGSLTELTSDEVDLISPCALVGKPWSRDELRAVLSTLGVATS